MRATSLFPAALLVLSAVACSSGGGDGGRFGGYAGRHVVGPDEAEIEISPNLNREVDILFMVDNSPGTELLQERLATDFIAFTIVLNGLPGGFPNVHLAVVSSDLGAGKYDIDGVPGCRHGGDRGAFQSAPVGPKCQYGSLNAGEHFISSIDGTNNFTGSMEDAFACIALLGSTGCEFEHQFGSVLRALGADGKGGPPPENANFLRPDATLAVVFVTNEDDCSAPGDSALFDPASRQVADPLGPLTSFRCNEFGHRCAGSKPPYAMADLTDTCTSAEDGPLLRVADVAQALKRLKPEPSSKVLVAAIAGPPIPYVVQLTEPGLSGDPSKWAVIGHACTAPDGSTADPGIRMKELVDSFPENGTFQSACRGSLLPALQRIAEEVGKKMAPSCLGNILDTNPGLAGTQPECTVVDHYGNNAVRSDVVRRHCDSTHDVEPCWDLEAPTAPCPSGPVVFRGGPPPRSTTFVCKVCAKGDTRPGCLYGR